MQLIPVIIDLSSPRTKREKNPSYFTPVFEYINVNNIQ